MLAAAFVCAVVVGAQAGSWLSGPRELVGIARIVDGDTLDLCTGSVCQRIRLCGIDTPERDQAGYAAARRALTALIAVEDLRCVPVGRGTVCDGRSATTSHDRIVAQCFHAKWGDIAGVMVARGHACDLTKFSGGHYANTYGGRPCTELSGRNLPTGN